MVAQGVTTNKASRSSMVTKAERLYACDKVAEDSRLRVDVSVLEQTNTSMQVSGK